ncbi:MAG: chromosome segregation protein SMC [Synergistaceae bacterium]|nr:chromosome segregation protein SMC [Synergistaceae bacterium]
MSISSLRLKGFKSFGRQCEFSFSRNFTAIVGPNGSGKSNILDALKWILGEGSASGLRITRQSDLLFQGSSSSPPAESAEVILKLQNGNEHAGLRRVYSQEQGSSLQLDGKRILLQELTGVKRRFSLEGEGFALIGQGEISQTIHQRPKERRRQLDSLFGIERYREKRDESVAKLEDAQNEAQRIQTLIDELKARRQEISDEVEIAVQAQGIIDSLEVLRHDYYFVRRLANEREQENLHLQRHILLSKSESFEKWNRLWTSALNHYEEELQGDNDTYYPQTSRLEILTEKINSIQRKAFRLSTQVKDIKSKRQSLTDELEALRLRQKILADERQKNQNECSNLQHEIDGKNHEFTEKEREIKKAQSESQALISKRKEILDGIARLRLSLSRSESILNASSSSRESLSLEISQLESERSSLTESLGRLTEKKNILEEKFTRLSAEYQQSGSRIQTLRRELAHAESQYSNADTSAGYPEAVRLILAAAEKNLLRSHPVTAADVFTCRTHEIAEAVDAYLGGRQYWLLVRTIEEAQEGIDFLRNNRAGRATYLPLERCRPKDKDNRLVFGSGVTGWAMDLVNVKPEWLNAVSHMMGDLLIVEDYATGAELVRRGVRFPIATTEGDIFAPSGTITGGAVRQKTGAVTARRKAEEFKLLITELTGQLENEESRRKNLRIEAEESESMLEELRGQINSWQRNLKTSASDLERLKRELSASEINTKKLTDTVNDDRAKLESLESELKGLPEINAENFGDVLAPLRNELRLLNERLNVTRTLYERVDVEISSVNERIERSENEIASGCQTETLNRNELFTLSREKKEAYTESLKLRNEILRLQNESADVRRKISMLRKKLTRSTENISSLKNETAQAESKIIHLEAECSQLIELWEDKYPYDKDEAKSTEGGRELTSSLRKLERELKSLGAYNLGAISEDQSLAERTDFLTDQLDDVNTSADELRALIADTDSQVERSFGESMKRIDSRFNELFVRLFGGGEARLILQDGESVWDKGVEIFARPPGKKLQSISQLSGGEQSLTSIALIFATLEAAGSPLAVLDEVDAALDEYNLIRFAELVREYSKSMQIIAMTHRRATMERADMIYGVTMIEAGLSAAVGINPENYA